MIYTIYISTNDIAAQRERNVNELHCGWADFDRKTLAAQAAQHWRPTLEVIAVMPPSHADQRWEITMAKPV